MSDTQIVDLVIDVLLVAGFGVQHSVIATLTAKSQIKRRFGIESLTWRGVQSLMNVLYILIAASLWRVVPIVIWDFSGLPALIISLICVAGWIWYFQLHLFEYDVGLAFGSTPFISDLLGRPVPRMEQWKVGTRRWIRFPVHTAFFPMFLAFPHMTASGLVFGVAANIYNVIGSVLYDKRLEKLAGQGYFDYQAKTGLIVPPLRRNPEGAAALTLPSPMHWRNPSRYLPALALGILGGLVYRVVLGATPNTLPLMLEAWGVAALLGLGSGVVLGLLQSRAFGQIMDMQGYKDVQSIVSTSAAVVSAVALLVWVGSTYLTIGTIPHLAVILPLWITVLWLGHMAVFFTGYWLGRPRVEPGLSNS